jgi:hypothetical protein
MTMSEFLDAWDRIVRPTLNDQREALLAHARQQEFDSFRARYVAANTAFKQRIDRILYQNRGGNDW